ncbi:MAG: outer membrane beta-barrel protein, partial [Bacteroidota bacterium]
SPFFQKGTNSNTSTLNNHNARVKLKHNVDPSTQFILDARLSFNNSSLLADAFQQSFVQEDLLSNEAEQENNASIDLQNWSVEAKYQKKLRKAGRYFTSTLALGNNRQFGDTDLNNVFTTFSNLTTSTETIQQRQEADRTQPNYKAEINYSEPLGKANYLQFRSKFQNDDAQKEKLFFDASNSSNNFLLNEELSNTFNRSLQKAGTGLVFKTVKQKYNWTAGLDYERAWLSGGNLQNADFERGFNFILPSSFFTYKFTGSKQFRAQYRTRTSIPRIEQLQPVIDNSDPLRTTIGNPDLRPEYVHQLNLNFNSFNQFYLRSIFVGGNLEWTQHKIINFLQFDEDLKASLLPINSQPAFTANVYTNYDTPIKTWNLKIGVDSRFGFNHSPIAINELEDRYALFTIDQSLRLQNKKKNKLDWQVHYTIAWNSINYRENTAFNRQFPVQEYLLDINFLLTDTWNISGVLEHIRYPKVDFSTAQNFTFLDFSLSKSTQDDKFSFYLKAKNILNVVDRLERTAIGNQFLATNSNRLGRIVVLGLVYKLRKFGT